MANGMLFGSFDPRMTEMALQQEQQKNMLAAAQLTPEQYLRYSAGLRGQMIGQGVANLFGTGQIDPRLQQASDAQAAYQEALSTVGDSTSPQFFRAFANAAAKRNIPTLAQQAATQAAELESTMAQTFQRSAAGTASMAQATRERQEVPLTIADRARLTQLQRIYGEEEGAIRFRQERDEAERQKARESAPKLGAIETKEAESVGKGAGDQFTKVTITDLETSAKKSLAVRELQILAGQVNTGTFTEFKAKAQAFAKEAGFDLGDPTNVQTLRAAIERGVAQTQVEQKGVQTDRDAVRYRTAGVLLTNTPAANQYIVDYQIALDNRVREKAAFFEKFRQDNKTSVGAERAWQEYIKDKDIFDSPSLSKYKDTFKMNDLAKRVRGGQASQSEKAELATLMRQFGLTSIPVPR